MCSRRACACAHPSHPGDPSGAHLASIAAEITPTLVGGVVSQVALDEGKAAAAQLRRRGGGGGGGGGHAYSPDHLKVVQLLKGYVRQPAKLLMALQRLAWAASQLPHSHPQHTNTPAWEALSPASGGRGGGKSLLPRV
jgi:hypothetical protein